ncbi:hypothetical protein, partial [Chlorobium phaeovibrioides]|uniref:hypothetical protein n=1 Tax=Chlorobium phaeovibrioides TaxID=1094 RepID=UPI001F29CC15
TDSPFLMHEEKSSLNNDAIAMKQARHIGHRETSLDKSWKVGDTHDYLYLRPKSKIAFSL